MDKILIICIILVIIISGVDNCTNHQERRTKALEKTAENVSKKDLEEESSRHRDLVNCTKFLEKDSARELVAGALVARHYLDESVMDSVESFVETEVFGEAIIDYRIEMMKEMVSEARPGIDCSLIHSLGLDRFYEPAVNRYPKYEK